MDLTLKNRVRNWFNEAVRLNLNVPQELRERLLHVNREKHPRLDLFINNMCEQFVEADNLCRKRGLMLKEKTMQETTYDMTDFFIKMLVKEATQMYESDLEKSARAAQAEALRQAEDFLAGGKENEFTQEGLTNEGETQIKTFKG